MRYEPGPIADTVLREELDKIRIVLDSIADGIQEIYTIAPEEPVEGQTVWADGVNWNPGSGAGMYEYRAGVWVKL